MPMAGSLSQDKIFLNIFQKYLDEKDHIEKYNPALKLFMGENGEVSCFLSAIFRRLEQLAWSISQLLSNLPQVFVKSCSSLITFNFHKNQYNFFYVAYSLFYHFTIFATSMTTLWLIKPHQSDFKSSILTQTRFCLPGPLSLELFTENGAVHIGAKHKIA